MHSELKPPSEPVCFVFGDEDILVRDRAKRIYEYWCSATDGMDHEVIDGAVRNSEEAQ